MAIKALELILNGDMASADGWIPESDWDLSGGTAAWVSTGNDNEHSLQQKPSLVNAATYQQSFVVSNTNLQNPDTYMAVTLGGGTAMQIRENGTYSIPMICGSSIADGLQIIAVNDTSGDTMTFDNISTLVKHFRPSSNLDSIYVTGNLKVPAGVLDEMVQGPMDEYPWDEFTDYSSGEEALGILNGERVYKSASTHADGAGGAATNYYLSYDGLRWILDTTTVASILVFTATADATLTPLFIYTGDTIEYYVDGVYGGTLASGVAGSIAVTTGQAISYRKPDGWLGVTQCSLSGDAISGSINQLSALTSLTYLNLYNTSVSGDISNLSNLTLLTYLNLGGTSVTGNISSLSALTSLDKLYLYSTSVTGDANCLDTQVLMTIFNGSWCSWSETEVGNCLASLVINEAAGDSARDCNVTIDGNNAAPSADGLADRDILVTDKGWTVTVTVTT